MEQNKEKPPSERYITLAGDPVHKKLRECFHQAADTKAALGATALVALIYSQLWPEQTLSAIAEIATANFLLLMVGRLVIDPLATMNFGKARKNKCIDTAPTHGTSPILGKHNQAIEEAFVMHSTYGVMAACLPLAIPAIATYKGLPVTSDIIISLSGGAAAALTRSLSGIHRFYKVTKGDWIIVDTPPKEKVAETAKEKAPGFFTPAPVPTR